MNDVLVSRIFELFDELKLSMGELVSDREGLIDRLNLTELLTYEDTIDNTIHELNIFMENVRDEE